MPRRMLVSVLIALVTVGACPAAPAELTVAEQVAKVKTGRKVKVRLNNGETIKGQMGVVAADQFLLDPPDKVQGTSRTLQFAEVQSVRPDGLTRGEKWVIFGVVWVVVGIVGKFTT